MDGLSSSYSMRNLMGRHYLEHLWVFLSAEFFVDVWGALWMSLRNEAPDDEDLRRTCLRGKGSLDPHGSRRLAFTGRTAMGHVNRGRRQRLAMIAAKRASASAWSAIQDQRTAACCKRWA